MIYKTFAVHLLQNILESLTEIGSTILVSNKLLRFLTILALLPFLLQYVIFIQIDIPIFRSQGKFVLVFSLVPLNGVSYSILDKGFSLAMCTVSVKQVLSKANFRQSGYSLA